MNAKVLSLAAFHGAVIVIYFCVLVASLYLPPMPHKQIHERWGGFWKYLTYWNLVARFLYFFLSFCIDFMKTASTNYHRFTKIRDKIYAGIIFPYGVFVVAVFWTLYSIDRELILPKTWDDVFPVWLNHFSHTLILPVLLLETYILRHRHPNRKDGLTITAAFGLIYLAWVLYLALVRNIWPYPVLQILNWGQRVLFFGANAILLILTYLIGEKINTFCWGDGIVSKTK